MNLSFGRIVRQMRMEKGLSQKQLADKLFVNRSSIASWETGRRIPNAAMILLLSDCLNADAAELFRSAEHFTERPRVILVDNAESALRESARILEEVLPDAEIACFMRPSEAIALAKDSRVALAFLDIELEDMNGLDLCRELLEISPPTNAVFLTEHKEYALDAWETGACGFLLKPLSAATVRKQLKLLRHPIAGLGNGGRGS